MDDCGETVKEPHNGTGQQRYFKEICLGFFFSLPGISLSLLPS
jgi:hypothetical protein